MLMNKYRLKLIKIIYQMCFLLGLSFGLVVLDVLPRYEQGNLSQNNSVMAQIPSDNDLQKYARAATTIENLRQNTYRNIKKIVGTSNTPQLACHQQQSFQKLPDNARSMAVNYCNKSERIVKQSGLSINQFNRITQQLKNNPALYKRVQQMMNR